jgi:hypothetical protein
MAIIASTLARIKSDPLESLGGKEKVNGLFAKAGHVWRECVWDPATTLGAFIVHVLNQNAAIAKLPHLLGSETGSQLGSETGSQLVYLGRRFEYDPRHGQKSAYRARLRCDPVSLLLRFHSSLLSSSTLSPVWRKIARRGATVDLAVTGNDRLCERIVAAHDEVAAMLATNWKGRLLQGAHGIGTGNQWQLAHTATRIASVCSSGTGGLSS